MELLIIVALIGTLTSLSVVSMRGNSSALNLQTSGVQCANLLESARGTAILRRIPVAVALMPAEANMPAALTVLAYQPDSSRWVQISNWEKLSYGVVMDPSFEPASNSALPGNSPVISPALPSLTRDGSTYAPGKSDGYAYLVFMPSGALYQDNSNPGMLRLALGTVEEGTVRLTNGTANYFNLFVNPSTGRVKIARPE